MYMSAFYKKDVGKHKTHCLLNIEK